MIGVDMLNRLENTSQRINSGEACIKTWGM